MPLIARMLMVATITFLAAVCQAGSNNDGLQSPVKTRGAVRQQYPKIVLYSVSWCPHCKAAKEYLTKNNIPFINRDVELDDTAMDDLTKKYKSQGVPVIVIGNDDVILKGFDQQKFEKAIKDMNKK